jgi:hypothetical protein
MSTALTSHSIATKCLWLVVLVHRFLRATRWYQNVNHHLLGVHSNHGLAHKGTAEVLDKQLGQPDMDYTSARDKIAEMIAKPYGCNPDCIKAQLDDSYQKMHSCGDVKQAKVTPHSGESGGGPKLPDTNTPM